MLKRKCIIIFPVLCTDVKVDLTSMDHSCKAQNFLEGVGDLTEILFHWADLTRLVFPDTVAECGRFFFQMTNLTIIQF